MITVICSIMRCGMITVICSIMRGAMMWLYLNNGQEARVSASWSDETVADFEKFIDSNE